MIWRLLLCAVCVTLLVLELYLIRVMLEARENSSETGNEEYETDDAACPELPERLRRMMGTPGQHQHQYQQHLPSSTPISKQDFQSQWKIMVPDTSESSIGSNNDPQQVDQTNIPQVFVCPQPTTQGNNATSLSCRGVALVYSSQAMFDHVKNCITVLLGEDGQVTGHGILGSHLLYADRATRTLLVAPFGRSLRYSSWPDDYEIQLRRLFCLLAQQYDLELLELNWHSFVADETTGRIYLKESSLSQADVLWTSTKRMWQTYFSWISTIANTVVSVSRHHPSPETEARNALDALVVKLRRFRHLDRTRIWKPPILTTTKTVTAADGKKDP
jgi:hypothetical protein